MSKQYMVSKASEALRLEHAAHARGDHKEAARQERRRGHWLKMAEMF